MNQSLHALRALLGLRRRLEEHLHPGLLGSLPCPCPSLGRGRAGCPD